MSLRNSRVVPPAGPSLTSVTWPPGPPLMSFYYRSQEPGRTKKKKKKNLARPRPSPHAQEKNKPFGLSPLTLTTFYEILRRTTKYYDVLRNTTTYYEIFVRSAGLSPPLQKLPHRLAPVSDHLTPLLSDDPDSSAFALASVCTLASLAQSPKLHYPQVPWTSGLSFRTSFFE